MLASWRSWLYRGGIFNSIRLPAPVISVGNLSFGGTGKSPFCIFLGEWCARNKISFAVLSRGYGRKKKNLEILGPGESLPTEERLGDEPWMIKQRLPKATLLVHADRARMAKRHWAEMGEPQLVLLDDGFQHWKAIRNWDVVMIDGQESLDQKAIPFGRLRESVQALGRADVAIITRSDSLSPQQLESLENKVERAARKRICPPWKSQTSKKLKILKASYAFRSFFSYGDGQDCPDSKKKWILVSGVAKPDSVRFVLQKANIPLLEEMYFPDHHRLTSKNIQLMEKSLALHPGASLLTTEKDWARWREDLKKFSAYGFRIQMQFSGASEILLQEFLEEVRCSISD
jgi:tetraacyldisaccharide 4'-kinase